jgi:hypothetical protein
MLEATTFWRPTFFHSNTYGSTHVPTLSAQLKEFAALELKRTGPGATGVPPPSGTKRIFALPCFISALSVTACGWSVELAPIGISGIVLQSLLWVVVFSIESLAKVVTFPPVPLPPPRAATGTATAISASATSSFEDFRMPTSSIECQARESIRDLPWGSPTVWSTKPLPYGMIQLIFPSQEFTKDCTFEPVLDGELGQTVTRAFQDAIHG